MYWATNLQQGGVLAVNNKEPAVLIQPTQTWLIEFHEYQSPVLRDCDDDGQSILTRCVSRADRMTRTHSCGFEETVDGLWNLR